MEFTLEPDWLREFCSKFYILCPENGSEAKYTPTWKSCSNLSAEANAIEEAE